jgi:hypothetical protein
LSIVELIGESYPKWRDRSQRGSVVFAEASAGAGSVLTAIVRTARRAVDLDLEATPRRAAGEERAKVRAAVASDIVVWAARGGKGR